ncbi:probable peroxisomal acyl-coenzyme A oxidase 1 [Achroia grisella]|uniref:probable peroxisomal acyl-coenzyme A oxidase 1 n=1 Tax=Achroia grisella TaxID=688607 RepID=UPI0027D332C4|nr:probable peroxisomal acyl-coenzyme A oxidase 1 [Achroia grisella]
MTVTKVNEDLVRERRKCTFDVNELTHFFDGGADITSERRKFEKTVLAIKGINDEIPEDYLSHKDRYENAVRKACLVKENLNKSKLQVALMPEKYEATYVNTILKGLVKDISPFFLHDTMFLVTIWGQMNEEQQAEWMPKAKALKVIGTYAQTELGHGTFIRGLETTATYDPETEEFVLNTPTLTAYKWWPGGLGHTANHCIVVAQLYSQGKHHGLQTFIVQIRDFKTHNPLPGIHVGEIGPKFNFQTANNGFLGFKNYRIPRKNMLMRNAQVLKDGTFVKSKNDKLTYGTLVIGRVNLINDIAINLAAASVIAVRYSAVRHQSKPKPNEPEPQILDYLTQQHKVFINIATSHAFRITGRWLWNTMMGILKDISEGKMEQLPELHAISCCMKAVCSQDSALGVEQCRLACGGHGFMKSSNLPLLYGVTTASITYEGENTVMMLQTARYLMKTWMQVLEGNTALTPTVKYLLNFVNPTDTKWENTPEGIIKGLQAVAAGKIKAAYDTMVKYVTAGNSQEDAWNLASVQLVGASEAHCRVFLCEIFVNEIQRTSKSLSPNLYKVLQQLVELYLVYWALEKKGDILLYSTISKNDIAVLTNRYEELLGLLRPNAVGLVDGYDIRDEVLNSTLGAYDGRVYERLFEDALKSPLNQEQVNSSFHKYTKPFMEKAKL